LQGNQCTPTFGPCLLGSHLMQETS
jgi:hypothetical protein